MGGVESAPDISQHEAGAPLTGRSVLVTRTREQAAALVDPLEALGAEVLCFPVIEVVDPEDDAPLIQAVRELGGYDWLVITSTNGVDRFFERVMREDGDLSVLGSTKVAAVGSATAACIREHGIEPDLVPDDFRAEGLIESFRELGVAGSRILIARAEDAREILPEALREMGARVEVVVTYRVVLSEPDMDVVARLDAGSVDIATFASGGTFRHFLAVLSMAGLDAERVATSLAIASVGPVTTATICKLGYEVAVEARESTMQSLVDAVVERFGTTG